MGDDDLFFLWFGYKLVDFALNRFYSLSAKMQNKVSVVITQLVGDIDK